MRRFVHLSRSHVFSPLLALLASVVLMTPAAVQATPYVITLVEQGPDVVATGSGEIDLTGLTYVWGWQITAEIVPSFGAIALGPADYAPGTNYYTGIAGPASFGSGDATYATTGSGDPVMFVGGVVDHFSGLYVPVGYVSGTPLLSTATWANTTLADLGVTPGIYTWTWGSVGIMSDFHALASGSGACQSFTIIVGNVRAGGVGESCGDNGGGVVSVPEPPALGLLGAGTLLVGGMVALRRRRYQHVW